MNIPKAWMSKDGSVFKELPPSPMDLIPLYAKTKFDEPVVIVNSGASVIPAKTLTDEEIMDESFKAGLAISKDTDVFLLEHDVEALVTFARAILRKAQEK